MSILGQTGAKACRECGERARAERDRLEAENAKLREQSERLFDKTLELATENAKLREQFELILPTDYEGNVLDIADTVHMLRSEYDGDHEWDDVVVELALTKWGGDRWIVRGSKGEAWACDCLRTGYDEDAYEGSDDAEPIVNPTLIEAENARLRTAVATAIRVQTVLCGDADMAYCRESCPLHRPETDDCVACDVIRVARELGIEVG